MHPFQLSLICALLFCGALASPPCEPGYGAMGVNSSCEICAPGTFDYGYAYCQECYPDTFQPQAGQLECNQCPPNTNSQNGATECISCPDGLALLETNECGDCPPGEYLAYGHCYPCPSGFFKAEAGIGSCMPCPRNSHSRQGASECIECAEDEALMSDGSCGKCPPGKYFDTYLHECMNCSSGSYTDSANVQQRCYNCGGNSFSAEGSSECVECPVGEVLIGSSQSCEKCEPGYYYNDYSLSCTECYYNQFSVYDNQLNCMSCMEGSFARPGSTTCFTCPRGQVYLSETDECGECSPGDDYNSDMATCGYDYYYYGMSSPEPFEELSASSEPLFELSLETEEPQPRVTDDPLFELGPSFPGSEHEQ